MQIRLVIGEQDGRYLNNLVMYLERNYMEKLEIFTFSDPRLLQEFFSHGSADVILIDETFGISAEDLKAYGSVAYLSEQGGDGADEEVRRVAKFKKPNLIYKDILDLYADGGNRHMFRLDNADSGQIIMVTGVSGGTGASTFAAALAKKYASRGKKVLYLNLEPTGMSTDFFSGGGNYHFDDVIFALKSQRADVRLKMESTVRMDASGVSFFEPCTNAMYMLELNHEEIMKIIHVLSMGLGYDYMVVDRGFSLGGEYMEFMSRMSRIVLVQDGGETSNSKFLRTMEALHILEQKTRLNVTGNMQVLYNRFSSSKSSSEIPGLRLPVLGKFPPVKHAQVREIMDYMLTKQEVFKTF